MRRYDSPQRYRDLREKKVAALTEGTKARLVSDLHVGHGRFSDIFGDKDEMFASFVDDTIRVADTLILAGDIFELWQCPIETTRAAHPAFFRALESAIENLRVVFIPGNHDAVRDFPIHGVEVVDEVRLAAGVRLVHGDEFDLYYKSMVSNRGLPRTLVAFHNFLEQTLGVYLRWPVRDHNSVFNRAVTRAQYPYGIWKEIVRDIARELGLKKIERQAELFLEYWVRGQSGDPSAMLVPVRESLAASDSVSTLVCGHSHVPGIVALPRGRYANIGSWTFEQATAGDWRQGVLSVVDVHTGRAHGDTLYRHLLDEPVPTFSEWWRHHYKGLLEFHF